MEARRAAPAWLASANRSAARATYNPAFAAGRAEAGRGADIPMQVSSSGATALRALVMFVVDATRPFSSPASLP